MQWVKVTARDVYRRTVALAPFHAVVFGYTLVVVTMVVTRDQSAAFSHASYLSKLTPVYLVTLPSLALFISLGIIVHRTNDWRSRRDMALQYLAPEHAGRFVAGLFAMMSFIVFMGSFTTFKNLMPDVQGGFPFDTIHAEIDRVLHFGQDPGPALVRLLPFPSLRRAVEWNYSILWAVLGFIPVFFVATHQAAERFRLRYLITLAVVWIVIGSLLALAFLSAGPAFYGSVTGDEIRFAAINEFLHLGSAYSGAADFQDYLWANHAAGTSALGSGISAFPSMHVALAMVNALFLREWSRQAGYAGFAYVGLILFSSIYLGWHYAIDGYVSVVVVAVLHRLMRHLFRANAVTDPQQAASIRL